MKAERTGCGAGEQIEEVCLHRARFGAWRSRKPSQKPGPGAKAPGALHHAPSFYVQDGVIPRTRIVETLRFIRQVGERLGLQIANVFHAGDGNIHPNILYDARDREQNRRVVEAGAEILAFCVSLGGSITGEHGVGMEKNELMPLLFSEDDLTVMGKLKSVFNPAGRFNPSKIFPTTKGCGEIRVPPQFSF